MFISGNVDQKYGKKEWYVDAIFNYPVQDPALFLFFSGFLSFCFWTRSRQGGLLVSQVQGHILNVQAGGICLEA